MMIIPMVLSAMPTMSWLFCVQLWSFICEWIFLGPMDSISIFLPISGRSFHAIFHSHCGIRHADLVSLLSGSRVTGAGDSSTSLNRNSINVNYPISKERNVGQLQSSSGTALCVAIEPKHYSNHIWFMLSRALLFAVLCAVFFFNSNEHSIFMALRKDNMGEKELKHMYVCIWVWKITMRKWSSALDNIYLSIQVEAFISCEKLKEMIMIECWVGVKSGSDERKKWF